MKKKISLLLCAGLLLSMLTGCSGGKLDLTWFTSKFTGKTAEDIQQEQESAAAEEAHLDRVSNFLGYLLDVGAIHGNPPFWCSVIYPII